MIITEYNELLKALYKLHDYCNKENYTGYNLLDSHLSTLPIKKLNPKVSFYVNQLNKRSPLNLRPILGIKKSINPKAFGLFLYSYSIIKRTSIVDIDNIEDIMDYFYNWLKDNHNKKYSGIGWGYQYDWPKNDGTITLKNTPNSVVSSFISRGIYEYYKTTNNPQALDVLIKTKDFIIENTIRHEDNDGICLSYTPDKKDLTINSNLLAAEILAYSDHIQGKDEFKDDITKILDFTMNRQNKDGSWFYSFDPITNEPKKQIDFHQGYVLESIKRICKLINVDERTYGENIQKGLEFYYFKQFTKEGLSIWRYPKKWPIDIHNQSQGIITFSLFNRYDERYAPFAFKIANLTVKSFQHNNGSFCYQKWPMFYNKISYMRWNNAWMMVALIEVLKMMEEKNENTN
jgi:hypothetical protein